MKQTQPIDRSKKYAKESERLNMSAGAYLCIQEHCEELFGNGGNEIDRPPSQLVKMFGYSVKVFFYHDGGFCSWRLV